MIIFIPSWEDISKRELSTDDLVGQIRAVMESEENYKILMSEYIPNLRYFLHRYDLLEANYENVFDLLQGFVGSEQRRVTLDELNFPLQSELFYTPRGLIIYFEHQKVGEVYFGEAGQIKEVKYFKNSLLKKVAIYDDRGMISSRQFFIKGSNESFIEYLDINKEWIFREYKKGGKCIVNLENNHNLNQKSYPNIKALKFELIRKNIQKIDGKKEIIVAVTDDNLEIIYRSTLLSHITLSFFEKRYSFAFDNHLILRSLLAQVNSIIVESHSNLTQLSSFTCRKIHQVSPFDTRFNLSVSQELKEEVIYFETRGLSTHSFTKYFNTLLTYLYEAPNSELTSRSFKIILRVEERRRSELKTLISNLLVQHFPQEYNEVDVFKSNQSMENTIDYEEVPLSQGGKRVKVISEGINLLIINQEEDLFRAISEARIIIDLSEEPDLFTQIAGISAGIPQINQTETEYIISKKNGLVVSDEKSFYSSLHYYLESLTHWQEARVHAVQQIRNYSGGQLFNRIKEILGGD